MPTSVCFNCGSPKNPPYTQRYCDDCEHAVTEARAVALSQGGNPAESARRALDIRAFSPKSNRPNPRQPFTTNDATQNVLRARDLPPNLRP